MLNGVPLAGLTEPQLADYAAMLITDQDNVPWGHAIIGLLTWRYWKRPDPVPLTILQRLIRTLFWPFTRGVSRLSMARLPKWAGELAFRVAAE